MSDFYFVKVQEKENCSNDGEKFHRSPGIAIIKLFLILGIIILLLKIFNVI